MMGTMPSFLGSGHSNLPLLLPLLHGVGFPDPPHKFFASGPAWRILFQEFCLLSDLVKVYFESTARLHYHPVEFFQYI